MEKKANKEKKSKLSLDDFKVKSSLTNSKEALEAITGGILGACHDGSTAPMCMNYSQGY